jgi:predicted nucleotidyltransferase
MMDLQEVEYVSMNWSKLAYDRDRWRGLVNAVMNFGFHNIRGIS